MVESLVDYRVSRMRRRVLAVVFLCVCLATAYCVGQAGATPYYSCNFENGAGAEWSNRSVSLTPGTTQHPQDHFLGQFGNNTVTLTLSNLPGHNAVTLVFDLYIINSWDGNNTENGPDHWFLRGPSGQAWVDTTFAEWDSQFTQSYPGTYPSLNPPATGARESKTLGYTASRDSIYTITAPTVAHTANQVQFQFSASGLQNLSDESWGLDNVTVYLENGPPSTPVVTDDGGSTTSLTQLHAAWTATDNKSAIVEYQYAIGTSPSDLGSGYVVGWTSVGTATSVTRTGLSLQIGQRYYFYVKAKNAAGLWSSTGVSDGIGVGSACDFGSAPVVTNVVAQQRADYSKKVDITYDVADADSQKVSASVMISNDNGATFSIVPSAVALSGDVGEDIATGTGKHIVWNSYTDLPGAYGGAFRAKVIAKDEPDAGTERDFALPGGGSIRMCYVPAGSFLMGNSGKGDDLTYSASAELPQHLVGLSGFWVGKCEVTRGQYRRFMDAGGYTNPAYWSSDGWAWKGSRSQPDYWDIQQNWSGTSFTQTDNHPVVGISWYEADAFARWAGLRLLAETEWEKAARWAGQPRVYEWGDGFDASLCNWLSDSLYPGSQTAPAGQYGNGASPYGCLDMAGNAWEWVADWYVSYPGSTAPFDYTGSRRCLRGGGWHTSQGYFRCAYRNADSPGAANNSNGFRVAR